MTDAAEEMINLMYEAPHVDRAPSWYTETYRPRWSRGYLVIDDGMLFALSDYDKRGTMVSTVLLRSLVDGQAAAHRVIQTGAMPKSMWKPRKTKAAEWIVQIEAQGRRVITANRRVGPKRGRYKRRGT
jgi:hypothetical protein